MLCFRSKYLRRYSILLVHNFFLKLFCNYCHFIIDLLLVFLFEKCSIWPSFLNQPFNQILLLDGVSAKAVFKGKWKLDIFYFIMGFFFSFFSRSILLIFRSDVFYITLWVFFISIFINIHEKFFYLLVSFDLLFSFLHQVNNFRVSILLEDSDLDVNFFSDCVFNYCDMWPLVLDHSNNFIFLFNIITAISKVDIYRKILIYNESL